MSHAPKRFDFSVPVRINLYSDTQSKPTPGMKQAMLDAEVGDEQGGSDPTVWQLCDRVAALLGKEAAVFLPSGTMCNQVAIATHCRPGDEILAHEDAHIQSSEGGAPGAGQPQRRSAPVAGARALVDKAERGEPGEDARQIGGVEPQRLGERGGGQIAAMSDLKQHARFGERMGRVEDAPTERADQAGMKAIEGSQSRDLRGRH